MLKAHQDVKWCLGERSTDYQGRVVLCEVGERVFKGSAQRVLTEKCSMDSGARRFW